MTQRLGQHSLWPGGRRKNRLTNPRALGGTLAQGGEVRMRKLFLTIAFFGCLAASTGCLIPIYSADPARRAQQLIFTSEDLRTFLDEWERIWFLDQPSHMKPIRTHGGII
jgi:hypothetical protein